MDAYLTAWRIREAFARLRAHDPTLTLDSSILVLCSAEGREASVLCDLGYRDVTISDLSPVALEVATKHDPRLKSRVLNAQETGLRDGSYDVVVIQDGLHHLQSPVAGLCEMLRVCRRAGVFLEPADSPAGNLIGQKWETNGDAVNYVFRWNRKLLRDLCRSYFASDDFTDLSFTFWHHNPMMSKAGAWLGRGGLALGKRVLDRFAGRWGNQFCGIIVKPAI